MLSPLHMWERMLCHPSTCGRESSLIPPTVGAKCSLSPKMGGNALLSLQLWEGMLSRPSTYGRECFFISAPARWNALSSFHLCEGMLSHPANRGDGMLSHLSACGRECSLIPKTVGEKCSLIPPPIGGNTLSSLYREGMLRHLPHPASYMHAHLISLQTDMQFPRFPDQYAFLTLPWRHDLSFVHY